MPGLNFDLLFDIGKQIVQDGNSDTVIKFALSGTEPLKAMKKVFSSVKILELYPDYYVIGWDKSFIKFYNDEPLMKFLLHQIGNSLQKFHMDLDDITVCQPILEKLVAKQKLITFSAGENCDISFLDQFFLAISTSLKHVIIPSKSITAIFRDSFNLESLNVLNYDGFNIASFCCKTESLEISPTAAFAFKFFPGSQEISPFLSSIKQLIINKAWGGLNTDILSQIMEHFSSLEILKQRFMIRYFYSFEQSPYILNSINCVINFVKNAIKIPSKAIFSFTIDKKSMSCFKPPNLDDYKFLLYNFDFDNTISDCFCFRKIVQSADTHQTTILEVQFFII